MFDWNDLKFFLAVAERGSTLAAGRALRVSQTTVARRLAALEEATGLILFDRHQGGYRLTPDGDALLADARRVSQAGEAFQEAAQARARSIDGTVRLTTEDVFANTLLAPMLAELHDLHPAIRIELDATSDIRDLGAGEADIALRGTSQSAPAGVVGRRICRNDWALYCSRGYAEQHGVPRTKSELRQHAIVGGGGGSLWRAYQRFLQQHDLEGQVAIHQGTSTGLLMGVRAGLGVGVLPCIVADGEADLIRCMPPVREGQHDLLLLTHERVRHLPTVRTAIDFLYERLKAHVRTLEAAQAA